jgi:hypothetical protein
MQSMQVRRPGLERQPQRQRHAARQRQDRRPGSRWRGMLEHVGERLLEDAQDVQAPAPKRAGVLRRSSRCSASFAAARAPGPARPVAVSPCRKALVHKRRTSPTNSTNVFDGPTRIRAIGPMPFAAPRPTAQRSPLRPSAAGWPAPAERCETWRSAAVHTAPLPAARR